MPISLPQHQNRTIRQVMCSSFQKCLFPPAWPFAFAKFDQSTSHKTQFTIFQGLIQTTHSDIHELLQYSEKPSFSLDGADAIPEHAYKYIPLTFVPPFPHKQYAFNLAKAWSNKNHVFFSALCWYQRIKIPKPQIPSRHVPVAVEHYFMSTELLLQNRNDRVACSGSELLPPRAIYSTLDLPTSSQHFTHILGFQKPANDCYYASGALWHSLEIRR